MRRILIILTLMALTAAACGDDDTATTNTAPTTEAIVTTTAAPTATTVAPTTTTTEAPPTTAAEPTGPLGVQWPSEGTTALYRATTWGGEVMDVEARIERDVEWMDGVWTTFTFGTPESGEEGLVIYLDVSETGVIVFKGSEGYTKSLPVGQVQREWFEVPMTIDLFEALIGPLRYEAPFFLSFTEGDGFSHILWVETEILSVSETLETPLGTVEDCFRMALTMGGPYIGGDTTIVMDVWLHPDHLLAKVTEMPVFADLELLEGWG